MSENRADSFLRMIRRSQRGRLKIYLGYVAGVGKTWQMLEEAHRIRQEGIDVVVGFVETHGRAETAALIDGLEVIPRRRLEYRGIMIEEMDLDAVLARKPHVVLVDELAHTNVPGSRHAKRYEDVQDLLSAGIHVISTLNVQHLESLYDMVEKIAGIKVRERIPDTVVADADEIVNVDLTTEDLTKRLQEGKVYPSDRVGVALANFFKKTNLAQLRELTLREVASQIDLRSRDVSETEITATPDQVMVCLSSRGPNSEMLLRYASRLAGRLNRNWYAVYVQTPSEEPTVIDSQTQRILSGTLTLAKQLGAVVFTYKGEDVAETILRFAKEYRVGHLVIGSPGPLTFWKKLLQKKNVVERLIQNAGGVTVVVLDTRKSCKFPAEKSEQFAMGSDLAAAPSDRLLLSSVLSPERIVIWNESIDKEDALRALVETAARDCGMNDAASVLEQVLDSEDQGSTFLNEGAAFPHVRIKGLTVPCMALGLAHRGLADVISDNPIECVFLILSPAEKPEVQLQILSVASRAAQSRYLSSNLGEAATSEEAFEHILDWEATEEPLSARKQSR
ncbi:MAG: PTS sugar transporter subunit IIA [Desulfobacteraceae bacterium]|nr:PTS sugar transporter subunit IIA [Desulfobacteraceae bacterium]